MAQISKITLPSGSVYDIKDAQARADIAGLQIAASGGMHYLGTTTTPLTDGATNSTVSIGGQSVTPIAGDIVIYINLKNDVTNATANNQWQILPSTVASNKAYFYYTGILGAGETSSQLIDSVKLADSVTQDMYKYFDFDLNVELKSAQVIYDDNGNVVATAVNGDNTVSPAIPGELDAKVTVADPDKEDTTILSWATT